MATSKKELEKTKELARLYYLNGDTQKTGCREGRSFPRNSKQVG